MAGKIIVRMHSRRATSAGPMSPHTWRMACMRRRGMRALAVRPPSDCTASLGWHLWRCLAAHSELEVEHEAGDVVVAPTRVRCVCQLLCCLLRVLQVGKLQLRCSELQPFPVAMYLGARLSHRLTVHPVPTQGRPRQWSCSSSLGSQNCLRVAMQCLPAE